MEISLFGKKKSEKYFQVFHDENKKRKIIFFTICDFSPSNAQKLVYFHFMKQYKHYKALRIIFRTI